MKRALMLAVLTAAVLAIAASPALAEGYNDGGWNYTSQEGTATYGRDSGVYVRNPVAGTDQIQTPYSKGPHGGYTTTTNKCQDCHSTHYALGSYMLLRANDRENACTFCHAGGGGSSINIQMDNDYDADGVVASETNYANVGHTLGYSGKAPVDIQPAFEDAAGLACFSCHSPHGNSARTIEVLANPGAAMDVWIDRGGTPIAGVAGPLYNGVVTEVYTGSAGAQRVFGTNIDGTVNAAHATYKSTLLIDTGPLAGFYDLNKSSASPPTSIWGPSPWASNIVSRGTSGAAFARPIFVDNRWLLLNNPNVKRADRAITVFSWERTRDVATSIQPYRGAVLQLSVGDEIPKTVIQFLFRKSDGTVYADARADRTGSASWYRDPDKIYLEGHWTQAQINSGAADGAWIDIHADGVNKHSADKDNPIGPADVNLGPDQDIDRNQAYMWSDMGDGGGRGFGSASDFCQACHAGSAGSSTQKALVYLSDAGGYVEAYSHDANTRH
ncbi:MAG: hypothetical protein KGZ40_03570 [Clostridiales bacterium]|nr:hypothetical protein [Clostridiales bacterium]